MPARTDRIAANFVWGEVVATDSGTATKERLWGKINSSAALMANARGMASVLQRFRSKWGKTIVTSWYRDILLNTLVKGDKRSGHLTASAVDFYLSPRNRTRQEQAWLWMQENLRPFTSQMIAYKTETGQIIRFHIALSFGGGRLGEVKEKQAGRYRTITSAATFPVRDPSAPVLIVRPPDNVGTKAAILVGNAQDAAGEAVSSAIEALRVFLGPVEAPTTPTQLEGGSGLPSPAPALLLLLAALVGLLAFRAVARS